LTRVAGHDAAMAMRRAMHDVVDEVGRVAAAEGIDCHYAKGGTVTLARTAAQMERLRSEAEEAHEFGLTEEDLRLLTAEEAHAAVGASEVVGGSFTPHCAAIHPARLVRGLAATVAGLGTTVYEQTPVLSISTDGCRTPGGRVRASVVIRATEGYTVGLPGERRTLMPLYSLMVATEPLGDDFWSEAGLATRPTFADDRRLVIYGQRTADGRLAFGGRGAPYHLNSAIRPEFDRHRPMHDLIRETIVELFPALADVTITHEWGGPLGVPRDWFPSVSYDRRSGFGYAGGYVGDGVSTTNLAGRTLADLITGEDSDIVRLPWVGHESPRWEPEPLRWLGVNLGLAASTAADRIEGRTGRPSMVGKALSHFLGG
ncbi:MAG TPA: FAD-dependent oxidoreductase, partial [Acidimicrobiales bacterium]|nr:FAD-dependent oxidoreductase [Acidimicrobiales bacterium]